MSPQPSPETLERLRQASALLYQRRFAEAAGLLGALKAQQPNLVEARRLLGLALRGQGDLGGAEYEFRDALTLERRADLFEALAATLEMVREGAMEVHQSAAFAPIYLRKRIGGNAGEAPAGAAP